MKHHHSKLFFSLLICLFFYQNSKAQDCEALFTWTSDGLSFHFTDQSVVASGDQIISWAWDFDDDTFSNQQNPFHTFNEVDEYDVELEIVTASGCEEKVKFKVAPCAFSVSLTQGSCSGIGEIPLQINISDVYDTADEINVLLDGEAVAGSPFLISAEIPVNLNLNITGDGLEHQLEIQSIEIGACKELLSFTLEDCSSDCFLSSLSITPQGGIQHTVNVGDDFFDPVNTTITLGDVVTFNWVGDGHSTTSDATTGPDSWNSGVVGFGSSYDVVINSPGLHRYYCIPHGGPGGVGMSGSIVANCPPTNTIDLLVSFRTTQSNAAGFEILVDGNPIAGSPINYSGTGEEQIILNLPGDGREHQIVVRDIADPNCELTQSYLAPDCGATPSCSLSLDNVQLGNCSGDNTFTISISANGINTGGSGFRVLVDGNEFANNIFAYDPSGVTDFSINIFGDGSTHQISIEDVNDPACTASVNISSPNCSLPCTLSELTIQNSTEAITHIIEVRDFDFFPKELEVQVGDKVIFDWTGQVAHTSTSDATTGSDVWNSGLLRQGSSYEVTINSVGNHPYYCIPHGGPGGVGMAGLIRALPTCNEGNVLVGVQFTSVNGSSQGYNIKVDNQLVIGSPFTYAADGNNQKAISITGDGLSHNILIEDAADVACSISQDFQTEDCSPPVDPCNVSVLLDNVSDCGTDEMLSIQMTISSTSTGSGFQIYTDGNLYNNTVYPYDASGTTTQTIQVQGSGQVVDLEIRDVDSLECRTSLQVELPLCGQQCAITDVSVDLVKNKSHIIEVRDFDFFPKEIAIKLGDTIRWEWTGVVLHTATSDKSSGTDSWNSGLLGQGGSYELVLTTVGVHPYYCVPHGAPGGIGMAGEIIVENPCEEGQSNYEIRFKIQQGSSAGYKVLVDQIPVIGSPFNYLAKAEQNIEVALPADDQIHQLSIVDEGRTNCRWDSSFVIPACNSLCFGFKSNFIYEVELQSLEVFFRDSTLGTPDSWEWNFGDGVVSTEQHPIHEYASSGSYEVCLTSKNSETNCNERTCQIIEVGLSTCEAMFEYRLDGLSIQFTDLSNSTDSIENWTYDLGNGIQLVGKAHPVYTFDSLGIYQICLEIEGGSCTDQFCLELNLADPCLSFDPNFIFTEVGDMGYQFADLTVGDADQWLWGFGDGTTSKEQNPIHHYEKGGEYRVCLLVQNTSNNCNFVLCEKLEVGTIPTSLKEQLIVPLQIFPNPIGLEDASIIVRGLERSDIGKQIQFNLFSVDGKLIQDQTLLGREVLNIPLENKVGAGIFFFTLVGRDHIYRGRFIRN